jgi:hypothetical protein
MSITVGIYTFEGPYSSTIYLEDKAGVYVILDTRTTGNVVVDVGESAAVKSRIDNHDRTSCWNRNSLGTLKVAVLYTPGMGQEGRMRIEQEIREQFNPVCGIR